MNFENVESDTVTVKDGEWGQIAAMIGDSGLSAAKIIVETDKGTLELHDHDYTGGVQVEASE